MTHFIVLVAILSIVNSKPLITKDKWVHDLIYLANSPSEYRNAFPNDLYFDGRKWYTDAINIHKALFNGRNIYSPTSHYYKPDPINRGDISSAGGMINACIDISTDFKKLKEGEPRLLYFKEHIGAYLGKERTVSKGVVNVVEATAGWEHKILFSYVDSNGNRRYFKGSNNIRGKWERHGKPSKWVQY